MAVAQDSSLEAQSLRCLLAGSEVPFSIYSPSPDKPVLQLPLLALEGLLENNASRANGKDFPDHFGPHGAGDYFWARCQSWRVQGALTGVSRLRCACICILFVRA